MNDKSLAIMFTKDKMLEDHFIEYFETDEDVRKRAVEIISKEVDVPYEVLEERFHREVPGLGLGIELYEIRIIY